MSDQLDVLKLVATRLNSAAIAYMVTGSIAASHYGPPRFTRDIDMVVELTPATADRVAELFEDEFYCDAEGLRAAAAQQGTANLIHRELLVKVDFIVRKDMPYRLEEFRRRRPVTIEGVTISMVAPEDLVLSKLVWMKESGVDGPGDLARAVVVNQSMTDTSPEVQIRFQRLLMERSGEERVRMACDMFQAARRLILAALPPDIVADSAEGRIALLLRTYGGDLSEEFVARVIADLRSR